MPHGIRPHHVGILGLLAVLSASGLATAADTPSVDCPPISGPVTVDGQLGEWNDAGMIRIGEGQLIRKDPNYAGPADLSGEIQVARDATTLYVAGRIHDDTPFWNSRISWLGDGVELFLDFSADLDGREPGSGYDEDANQLLLHPLAPEVRWTFGRLRGRPGAMDDPVDGVRLAALPMRDAKGATTGYVFELALPLSNFTDEPLLAGRTIGFDVALSDSDGLPEQKNYATWSGRRQLSEFPGNFGRMVLRGAPPEPVVAEPTGFPTTAPLAVLVAALGSLLFLWLARTPTPGGRRLAVALERLRRVRVRTKMAAVLALVLLLALTELGAQWATGALAEDEIESHRELFALVSDVAGEAGRLRLLEPRSTADEPAPLISLLAGRAVSPPVEYDYDVIPPVAEVPHRTLDGTPFLRRDIPVVSARTGEIVVHPPIAARSATLVYSWHPDPGRESALAAGDVVAEVRLAHEDGRVDAPTLLRYGRHVDEAGAALVGSPPEHPGAPAARVAFLTSQAEDTALHADQLTIAVPDATTDTPLARIEIEPTALAGRFVLHGITLEPTEGAEPLPLPLGRPTESGIPTYASPFPSPQAVLEVDASHPWAVLRDLDARADRLWLLVSLRRGYAPRRYRAPVLLIDAVFDDGSVDGPFRLENGLTVEAEAAAARQHGQPFLSQLGFEWGLPGQPRRHVDVMPLPLERAGRRLRELQFEFAGEEEVVRIASITAGAENPSPRLEDPEFLDSGPDGYEVNDEDRRRLAGLAFTLYRDDAAIAGTMPGAARDRMLARRLTREQARTVAESPDGLHEVRRIDGEEFHTLLFRLQGGRAGDILELGWKSSVERRVEKTTTVARAVLVVLLCPLLVLLLSEVLMRVPSLHARLVLAFAAAAAVPVLLATFAVPAFVGSKIERAEEQSVREKAGTVKRRLASLRTLARKRAEEALGDPALQEALRQRSSEGFRGAVAEALRDIEFSISAASGGEARVALEVFPLSSAGEEPIVFPEQARWTVFAGRTVSAPNATELAYRWSRLYASGVARQYDTVGDWRTTLVVELPVDVATLEDAARGAGGDTEVLMYTPRGFPLVATLETRGEESAAERARKRGLLRRIVSEQEAVVEPVRLQGSLYTVAYDVLGGGSRDVSLVATAVPRTGAEALLERVGTVSLLVFGAGVLMQFLLAGLVVGGTTTRFQHALGRARRALGGDDGGDAPLDGDEMATLDRSLDALRGEHERYRTELAHLHDAVGELGAASDPDQVVARALDVVRRAVDPAGALLLVVEGDARVRILGGFRGEEDVAGGALVAAGEAGLAAALRGDPGPIPLGDGELGVALLAGFAADAYPLGDPAGPGGALVLLHAPGATAAPPAHPKFVAALARHVGIAFASARLVRLAVHDPGTGIYVPSFFEERLRGEVDRAVAAHRPIALLLLRAEGLADDDEGQRQRRRLAETIRDLVPARAFAGVQTRRTIGVAVPESDRSGAEALSRELLRAVAERGLPGIRVGIAACPEDAGSAEFLQAEARRRLAEALSGRPADSAPVHDGRARLVDEARQLGVVFQSAKGISILETVERIAASDLTILVEGETGTGKEVVADLIHHKSARRDHPLVKVNCAALPDALLESELFGYEPGAFTGADRHKPGRFELADGGTIFLDEIGDIPPATQVKLLRVLEDHVVEHLGGTRPVPVDVRVIAATNRDLRGEMAAGRFREDLFYRLNAVNLVLPPLRARKEDIAALVPAFVRRAAEAHGRRPPTVGPDAMDLLYRHDWPGNVRELRNAIEQAVVLTTGDSLRAVDLGPALRSAAVRRGPPRPVRTAGRAADSNVPERQQRLLARMQRQEWVTNSEYCELVGISTRTGLRDLKELLGRGLIVKDGKRRGARYRLA